MRIKMVAQYSPKEPKYRMFICPTNTCWEKLRETFPLGVPVVKPYPNTKIPGYKMMHLKVDVPCLNQEQFQILSDFFELNPSSEAPAMYWTAMKVVGWCIRPVRNIISDQKKMVERSFLRLPS
ncbi:MAG: hypothetical protein AB1589_36280 [Cyanobacteriota bacterium]